MKPKSYNELTDQQKQPYEIEGVRVLPIGRGCIIRNGYIGRCHPFTRPTRMDEVQWYRPEQIAARAKVPVDQISARLRDRWSFADLVKPAGHERLVEARRDGIPYGESRISIKNACKMFNVSVSGLEARIRRGDHWSDVLAPGRLSGEQVQAGQEPPTPRTDADVKAMRGRFIYRGYLDTMCGHCRRFGRNYQTVRTRVVNGMSFQDAMQTIRKERSDKGRPNPKRGYRDGVLPPTIPGLR